MSRYLLFALCQVVLTLAAPPRLLRSPCPEVFDYERFELEGNRGRGVPWENLRWRAVVSVPASLPVFLKLKLLTPAALFSKYVGRIELAENKSAVVKKINSGKLEKIKYYVYFPAKIPIPDLILVEVNSRVICSRPPAPTRLKTILTLEHSLTPVTANVTLRGGFGYLNPGKDAKSEKFLSKCGRGVLKNPLTSVSIRDWPWMVPLFRKTDLGLQFFCSSTLVGYEFAVTAAHCIKLKNSEAIPKEKIVAYAGRFDLSNWTEEDAQPRQLSHVFIHPDFDPETLRSDLAVLRFSKPVEPSPRVEPACLWAGDEDLSAVVGKKGVVFGWGADGLGHKITPTPSLAVMPIVSQEDCLRSKMEFLFLTSNRTLCAGFRNGTGPCSGDSGGGLLIPVKGDNGELRWMLRGVVSLSLLKNSEIMCDVQEYTVFTDVAKYRSWMTEVMSLKERENDVG